MAVQIKHRFSGEVICEGETLIEAVRANLADLRGAYLGGAYLRGADLRGAYLGGADLGGADLGGAYLGGAYLRGADLGGADLGGADLGGAYLRGADLGGADLGGAYLGGADLGGAYLGGADLGGAYLGSGESRAKLAWQSHDLIAEILRRAAGDDTAKLKVAGLVLLCRERCWRTFLDLRDPLTGWALGVLAEWVTDKTPREVREIIEANK